MFKVGVAICLVGLLINDVQSFEFGRFNKTHIECPNQLNPGILVADEQVNSGYFETLIIRIPDMGLLENPISCLLIVDKKNGHNEPNISQGGLGSHFVEVIVQPWLIETLSYRVQVYTMARTTTSTTGRSTVSTSTAK